MDMKSRLDLIIKELGISGRAFEKAVGLTNGSYASLGDGVGADKLKKILIKFPNINSAWLLTGEGEMLKNSALQQEAPSAGEDVMKLIARLTETNAKLVEANVKLMEINARQSESMERRLAGIEEQITKKGDMRASG